MEYLIAVTLFAISTSITPGPNNIMVMTSALNFGIKKTLPLLSGICVGFSVMLLVVGLGFGQVFNWFPDLHLVIKCAGIAYLLYLAWLIARSGGETMESQAQTPLTFINGALFQWVNAKAWVVATGAIAAFTSLGEGYYGQNMTIALIFLVAAFPCVGTWLLCGSVLQRVLKQQKSRVYFNYVMAALLVLSVIPVVIEVYTQLGDKGL
ncbi:LysE family translocator [Pseudoalteromonas sp. Of7M-16]|uniref:LysE family translocator n=1 Tax=Pseudoalteromonas sp. Of7M-16 TaxID=2917756 RepID=UPI001EF66879|nr:LysE family translocator [Pseudoalteromonas sp. Of7M-16]MCG7548114.1 LysE family translocator [Pseudoalteromonas sp. Of7M-16]